MHSLWQYLYVAPFELSWWYTRGHFRDAPSLCFKARCGAVDVKIIYYSHVNKTHFYPRFESENFWNSEMAYFLDRVLQPELYFEFSPWLILNDEFYSKSAFLVYTVKFRK